MELVERYLQAVKFWLPKSQKDDIIAELSEDIYTQIEEQKLNSAEVKALLKRRGNPMLVANRYQPQRYLIGPTLFPLYWFVLRIVLCCYVTPFLISALFFGHHVQVSFLAVLINPLAVVTLLFAAFERRPPKFLSEDWDPARLPIVRAPNQIPRSGSIIEIVVNLLFVCWWASNMYAPQSVHFSDVWPRFFWSFLVLALANAAAALANLRQPYWTTGKAVLRLATDATGGALFCWLLKSNIVVGIPSAPALVKVVNKLASESLLPTILVCTAIASFDIYRLLRLRPKPPMTPLTKIPSTAS